MNGPPNRAADPQRAGQIRATMDLTDVRRHHLSLVFEHLIRHGARTRAGIARDVGLTKTTVSAVTAELIDMGLAHELPPVAGRMGRPALHVAANVETIGALGLEVRVGAAVACVVDLKGTVRARRIRTGSNRQARPDTVVRRLRSVSIEVLRDADSLGIRCVGAGLALPGLVDPSMSALVVAPNLHWLDVDVPTAAMLGLPREFGLDVDNEANLGGMAELRFGAGRDYSSFIYVSAGRGVGAAIVVDGTLMRGAHGFAGELGHVLVEPGGEMCACGMRGCLETVAGEGRTASPDRVANAVAGALRAAIHLVDPQAVILGGGLANRGEAFAHGVEQQLRSQTIGGSARPVDVRRSTLRSDTALIGAATIPLEALVADPSARIGSLGAITA